jgi:hypothetical protein
MVVPSGLDLLPAHGRKVRCVVGGNRFVCGNGAGRTTAYAELLLEHGGFPAAVVGTEGIVLDPPSSSERWAMGLCNGIHGKMRGILQLRLYSTARRSGVLAGMGEEMLEGGVVESGDLFLAGFRREKSGL